MPKQGCLSSRYAYISAASLSGTLSIPLVQKKGDATLFYSLTADGEVDPKSLHGSCPTLRGEKWSATKWLHVRWVCLVGIGAVGGGHTLSTNGGFHSTFGFGAEYQRAKWGECLDVDKRCVKWAALGECEKNPGYMLTSCRKACHKCGEDAEDNKETE